VDDTASAAAANAREVAVAARLLTSRLVEAHARVLAARSDGMAGPAADLPDDVARFIASPAMAADRWVGAALDQHGAGVALLYRASPLAGLVREWWALARGMLVDPASQSSSAACEEAGVVPLAGALRLTRERHGGAELSRVAACEAVVAGAFDVYVRAGTPGDVALSALLPVVEREVLRSDEVAGAGAAASGRGGRGRGGRGGRGGHSASATLKERIGSPSLAIPFPSSSLARPCIALGSAGIVDIGRLPRALADSRVAHTLLVLLPSDVEQHGAMPSTASGLRAPARSVLPAGSAVAKVSSLTVVAAAVGSFERRAKDGDEEADAAAVITASGAAGPAVRRSRAAARFDVKSALVASTSCRVPAALYHVPCWCSLGFPNLSELTLCLPYVTVVESHFMADQRLLLRANLTGCARLQVLGPGAFRGCSNLATVRLPMTLRVIGAEFCARTDSLSELSGPFGHLREFPKLAFANARLSPNVIRQLDGLRYLPRSFAIFAIPGRVSPAAGALDLSGLTKVTRIRSHALADVYADRVKLPPNTRWIGSGCLSQANPLVNLDLKGLHQLCEIGSRVLEGCASLRTVTLPASLRVIGEAFAVNCVMLSRIDASACRKLRRVGTRMAWRTLPYNARADKVAIHCKPEQRCVVDTLQPALPPRQVNRVQQPELFVHYPDGVRAVEWQAAAALEDPTVVMARARHGHPTATTVSIVARVLATDDDDDNDEPHRPPSTASSVGHRAATPIDSAV
jgi:hypothetical protein